jgi:segregation and condensation protein B
VDEAFLVRALEAVIFASADPLPLAKIRSIFAPDGVAGEEVDGALDLLRESCGGRGIELRQVAEGYQFRTRSETASWVARLETPRAVRFSRAAMETLAVVAYRQPITRAEMEEVRGVDCGGVLKSLLDRGLIRILGKKEVPGRPILYGTSKKFLEAFGLPSLAQLPSLRDMEEMLGPDPEGVEGDGVGAEESLE